MPLNVGYCTSVIIHTYLIQINLIYFCIQTYLRIETFIDRYDWGSSYTPDSISIKELIPSYHHGEE